MITDLLCSKTTFVCILLMARGTSTEHVSSALILLNNEYDHSVESSSAAIFGPRRLLHGPLRSDCPHIEFKCFIHHQLLAGNVYAQRRPININSTGTSGRG